jgi:3,4-dehydroadipyl-CoA semialdehyde dehydrogenase
VVRLSNYVLDRWQEGQGPFRTLVDPATEEIVAETSTSGLDFKAVMGHARTVGGPALRSLTFAERGALLKAMSRALHADRDRLLEVAMTNGGNTRSDAKFDIDGATFTLSHYARLGVELGDKKLLADGESQVINPAMARFHGRHFWTSLRGVAVHINAFNFPAWGTFEKAACAFLAGMPVVTKPATSTSWLAYEMAKIVVDAEILPAGAFQFIGGGVGDLLDHLTGQDVLAFTGSADTGALLRGVSGHVHGSARVNIEADSLNAMVIGPDVERRDPVYDAAVRNITTEMTQKAGQKCTAIRRIMAPAALVDALVEDVGESLDRIRIGVTTVKGVRMGPLTTAGQLRDYREGVARLTSVARIVHGSATDVTAEGADGKGYFAAPVLLQVDAGTDAGPVHDHEVFGPVATVLAYDGTAATAGDLVARGKGSLVTSVFSSDRAFLGELLPEVTAWNGRVLTVDKKVADQATPHGMVLPGLLHGGPGRAGGGAELGGVRGVQFYMNRTAVQGNRALIEKLLG